MKATCYIKNIILWENNDITTEVLLYIAHHLWLKDKALEK